MRVPPGTGAHWRGRNEGFFLAGLLLGEEKPSLLPLLGVGAQLRSPGLLASFPHERLELSA